MKKHTQWLICGLALLLLGALVVPRFPSAATPAGDIPGTVAGSLQEHEGQDIFGATFMLKPAKDNRLINVASRALHIPCVRLHDVVQVTAASIASDANDTDPPCPCHAAWYRAHRLRREPRQPT